MLWSSRKYLIVPCVVGNVSVVPTATIFKVEAGDTHMTLHDAMKTSDLTHTVVLSFSVLLSPIAQMAVLYLQYTGIKSGRSWWPSGPRYELSSLSRKLGLWVRIPLKA
jgi:hypothetical protein